MEGERAAEMERRAIAGGAGAGPSSLAILPIKGSMGREVGPPTQGHRVAIPDAVASSLQQRRVIRWERFLPRRSLRVLLVEPDDSTRHIVTALLRKSSYHVAAVADGVKAWDVVKEKSYNFDLILSEVEVPSISGISLLSKIMGSELSRNIPVIMMSSQDSVSVVFRCMQKGAVDFLVKPVRKNELRNLWQHVWRRHCSISYGNGPENMPKNQSLSESMSDNDAAINDARDSKMAEGGDDSDDLSSGSKPLVPIHIEDKEEKQSQKLEEGVIDSILGSNDNRCARNGFQEKDVLNHSAASAFSRYANTGICSLGQKSQPQLQRSDLESPQDQRPPDDVDGGDRLQASAAPHFGMLPFPFPVNAAAIPFQNFCASGYGPLVPPMFYHEPSAAVDRESEEEIQHPSLLGEHSNGGGAEMMAAAAAAAAMNGRSGFDCAAGKDFDPNRSHREAALMKFRMKRKDRCFEKKVRYHSRKMLAEQRPRVKGQFVRQPAVDPSLLATEMEN